LLHTAPPKYGEARVQAGGGWVNDSEPEAEFQETVNKGKAIQLPQWHCYGGWVLKGRAVATVVGGEKVFAGDRELVVA
jgi:hypothetical protein